MKQLNKGDRVSYDGSVYEIVAVVMSTAYLRAIDCVDGGVCSEMQDVCCVYKIEFLESEEK